MAGMKKLLGIVEATGPAQTFKPFQALKPFQQAYFVEHWEGPDTINWLGSLQDVPHHSALCISPPPFGTQCTMHVQDALRSCLQLRSCRSLACPDPKPYARGGKRRDRIAGPVCQARSASSVDEWRGGPRLAARHGMCLPNACQNFFLFPVRLPRSESRVAWHDAHSQIVLLSEAVPESVWSDWLG